MTEALSRLNFRDLGGLPASDGRHVRYGVLYRSEGPASFDFEHRQELSLLDFRLVCDLRAEVERQAAPNDWCGTARLLELDITNDLRAQGDADWAALRDDAGGAAALSAMKANYAAIPGALHPYMGTLVGALLDGGTPALLHCTAGKDRTGVLVALLLTVLGVEREAVLADYLRSDVFGRNLRLGGSIADAFQKTYGFVPSEATISAMIGVFPDLLESALDAVALRWGSVDVYFDRAGVDGAARQRLRAALLVADGFEDRAVAAITE